MSYSSDVFVSYRHSGVVYEWVQNHFCPRLREWLTASAASEVSVFIDTTIETGASWPHALRNALAHTKLLVPVYSPEYFRSPWCQAEFKTFLARQEACGIPSDDDVRSLIVPVKFNDGEHFPEDATRIMYHDLSSWNMPYPVFAESTRYLDFAVEVQRLAEQIARRLADVPGWQSSWPIIDPDDVGPLTDARKTLDFPHL